MELERVEFRYGGYVGGGACQSNRTLEVSGNRKVSLRFSTIKESAGRTIETNGIYDLGRNRGG